MSSRKYLCSAIKLYYWTLCLTQEENLLQGLTSNKFTKMANHIKETERNKKKVFTVQYFSFYCSKTASHTFVIASHWNIKQKYFQLIWTNSLPVKTVDKHYQNRLVDILVTAWVSCLPLISLQSNDALEISTKTQKKRNNKKKYQKINDYNFVCQWESKRARSLIYHLHNFPLILQNNTTENTLTKKVPVNLFHYFEMSLSDRLKQLSEINWLVCLKFRTFYIDPLG